MFTSGLSAGARCGCPSWARSNGWTPPPAANPKAEFVPQPEGRQCQQESLFWGREPKFRIAELEAAPPSIPDSAVAGDLAASFRPNIRLVVLSFHLTWIRISERWANPLWKGHRRCRQADGALRLLTVPLGVMCFLLVPVFPEIGGDYSHQRCREASSIIQPSRLARDCGPWSSISHLRMPSKKLEMVPGKAKTKRRLKKPSAPRSKEWTLTSGVQIHQCSTTLRTISLVDFVRARLA